jgi:hypothetical protein
MRIEDCCGGWQGAVGVAIAVLVPGPKVRFGTTIFIGKKLVF